MKISLIFLLGFVMIFSLLGSVTGQTEPTITKHSIFEGGMPETHIYFYEICAGDKRLITPEVTVTSDKESYEFYITGTLQPFTCLLEDITVKAINPETIKLEISDFIPLKSDIDDAQDEIKRLSQEIEALKEQLEKKDAVLMEQLKVISDLASMIQKTIFEPILNYFSRV